MPEIHVFTAFFLKLQKIPVLLDIHDLTPELLTSKWEGKLSKFLKPVIILFEKLSCWFSDHIITVTDGCKQILGRRSAPFEKISVIFNTADTSIFPFNDRRVFKKIERDAVLLYHGTIAERFGLHVIIDAMPYILDKVPGTILKVYGKYDPGYKRYLENKIFELNLRFNVILEENRTHEEIYNIMNSADIEVVPYISNEYMNLSLSTKAFECASAGLPIVATDLQTMKSAFSDNAIKYAKDRNPRDFADKIIELCCNSEARRNMVLAAYASISKISGDVMENKYLQIIEYLTGLEPIIPSEENNHKVFQHEIHSSENVK